jgi:pimeloyl-ACP methyl ester carboxylesterase
MTEHDEKEKGSIRDCWTYNGRVAISSAGLYVREIQSLMPRRCIAVSLRARGKSDAPETGYTFEDHVSDIDSVIHHSELKNYCIIAYSMGVPYAIEHAARNTSKVKGLVIGDYKARAPAIKRDGLSSLWPFQEQTSRRLAGSNVNPAR